MRTAIHMRLDLMSNHAEERAEPAVPACAIENATERKSIPLCTRRSHVTLIFNGYFLLMTGIKHTLSLPAVSGRPVKDKGFDYSVERQKIKGEGAIPAGEYWIQPSQMWENAWYKRGTRIAWGNFRLTIHPRSSTQTYGRGGFFIHGGSQPGSAGCIDLAINMDKFVEQLTKELGGLPQCYIPLTVRYSKK
ncbi:MAG: DUF2778 domain-containing protein [Candidatus Accumulibacter sp.]|nr:DUF2778 domain-containing protein [Accumulibacter sp.]